MDNQVAVADSVAVKEEDEDSGYISEASTVGMPNSEDQSGVLVPPATNNRMSGLPLCGIMASIRSELGHALSMPIHDVISQSASMLGLDLAGAMTLKDKAICVARELNIGT